MARLASGSECNSTTHQTWGQTAGQSAATSSTCRPQTCPAGACEATSVQHLQRGRKRIAHALRYRCHPWISA